MENKLDVLSSRRNIWVSNPPYSSVYEKNKVKKKRKRRKRGRKEERKEEIREKHI